MVSHGDRKDQHVSLAMSLHDPSRLTPWADVSFVHHGLPDTRVDDVDIETEFLGTAWPCPFYINAMTGGTEATGRLNAALARAAGSAGVAIASGSQHVALRDPSREHTFRVIRQASPSGFVMANVGPTVSPRDAVRAVDMLEANALQIHINVAQEIPMPEGDRDFTGWENSIEAIIEAVDVPVIVKEVGFGLSRRTIECLVDLGASAIDVAGNGGTDFIAIETSRRPDGAFRDLIGWGQSAPLCLLESLHGRSPVSLPVLASGAVRTPLDVVRGLALGACAVGASAHFLHTLTELGDEALYEEIVSWREQIRSVMALLGVQNIASLSTTDLFITGTTGERARLLGIDLERLASRFS
nr:type 2 isopentenyl-diphosphate Delta-isomerase [Schaalia vaccimaxillae]